MAVEGGTFKRDPASSPAVVFRAIVLLFACLSAASPALAWSNGGYSADPANPDYGTHDWIAEHALAWLPAADKAYLTANRVPYLYGTELPDNAGPPDGIGDQFNHHIYYYASGALQDDVGAVRAAAQYDAALAFLQTGDERLAAKTAGVVSGYLTDVAVFGHVMGASTDWGAEVHHADYEDTVTAATTGYASSAFDPYLAFDGSLDLVTAYDATLQLAYGMTFGSGATRPCTWMDANYDWADAAFRDSAGASLNRAANALADVLHTLAAEADYLHTEGVAPTVAITSPDSGAVTASASVTLTGVAADNVGVVSVTWASAATGSSGTASGTTSWTASVDLALGANGITVRATDAAGNIGMTGVTVTYDPVAPTVNIKSPAASATLAPGTITVAGSASDNVAVARVQVSADGAIWSDCGGTTSWVCPLTVGVGTTAISAKVTDAAGNSGTAWVRVTVVVLEDLPNGHDPSGSDAVLPLAVLTASALALIGICIGMLSGSMRRKRKPEVRILRSSRRRS